MTLEKKTVKKLLFLFLFITNCAGSDGYRRLENAVDKREHNIINAVIKYMAVVEGKNCVVKVMSERICNLPHSDKCPVQTDHIIKLHCVNLFLNGNLDGEDDVLYLRTDWEKINGFWMMTNKQCLNIADRLVEQVKQTSKKLERILGDEK